MGELQEQEKLGLGKFGGFQATNLEECQLSNLGSYILSQGVNTAGEGVGGEYNCNLKGLFFSIRVKVYFQEVSSYYIFCMLLFILL